MSMAKRKNPLMRASEAQRDPIAAFTSKLSPKQQEVKMARRENAADALGTLNYNIERYIFTKGQFSVIEFLHAICEQTGPMHSIISTWTAAGKDISEAHAFLQSGRLLSTQWVVDFTFQRRKPAFCGQLRNLYGQDAIRVTSTHAKFLCLWNDTWNIMVLTSANLNMNPRNENYLVRESPELVQFHRDYVAQLFQRGKPDDILEASAAKHKARFRDE